MINTEVLDSRKNLGSLQTSFWPCLWYRARKALAAQAASQASPAQTQKNRKTILFGSQVGPVQILMNGCFQCFPVTIQECQPSVSARFGWESMDPSVPGRVFWAEASSERELTASTAGVVGGLGESVVPVYELLCLPIPTGHP